MAHSRTAEATLNNRDLYGTKIPGMTLGSLGRRPRNGRSAPIILVDEPVGVYRGPLLVWFGFFITRFLGGGVGLGLFCVVVLLAGGTWV